MADTDEIAAHEIRAILALGIPLSSLAAMEYLDRWDQPEPAAVSDLFKGETQFEPVRRVIAGIGPVRIYGFLAAKISEPSLGAGVPSNGLVVPLGEYGVPSEQADLYAEALVSQRLIVAAAIPPEAMMAVRAELAGTNRETERLSASLVLGSVGDRAVAEIADFLADFERAYNSFLLFDSLTGEAMAWHLRDWRPLSSRLTNDQLRAHVWPEDRLTLKRVRLESPGFWEFVGLLNPLTVIRQYLQDHHERRKDRAYREAFEASHLSLENELLINKVIMERVNIGRSVGLTNAQMAPLVNEILFQPLHSLLRFQDDGLIGEIELIQLPAIPTKNKEARHP